MSARYSDLFSLGYLYRALFDVEGALVKPKSKKWTVLWALARFGQYIERINLRDRSMIRFVNKWQNRLSKKYRKGQFVSEPDSEIFSRELSAMSGHFVNEVLGGIPLFTEITESLINPDLLRKGLWKLLGSNLYNRLADGVRMDLEDGIKALSIGLWTPCVMITLRAIEGVLREYYTEETGEDPVDDRGGFLSWAQMLDRLSSMQKITTELFVYLSFLKDRRNEADHPGRRFEQEVAEKTLLHTMDALKSIHEPAGAE